MLIASLCAIRSENSFWGKQNGAIHFFRFTELISHVLFRLLGCELRLFDLIVIMLLRQCL